LPQSGFSSASTATSSPLPIVVKVSPEKMFSETLTVDVVVIEDAEESLEVGKGDEGDEEAEDVSTSSISLRFE
jgi:hypothetical protein